MIYGWYPLKMGDIEDDPEKKIDDKNAEIEERIRIIGNLQLENNDLKNTKLIFKK
jgi:hypothetical protein